MDILDNKYREIFLAEEAKQVMSVILSTFTCVSNSRSHSHFFLTVRMSHTSLVNPSQTFIYDLVNLSKIILSQERHSGLVI